MASSLRLFESEALPVQRLSLFDYDLAEWETVDERTATSADTEVVVTIDTNADRFIESDTNALQMRLEWFNPGNVFSSNWGVRIDRAIWTRTP